MTQFWFFASFALVATLSAQTFTTLANFNVTNGANPTHSGLVQATNGKFYGTTFYGGASNYGTIFSMTPSGKLTTIYSFQMTDGAVYGTTSQGGLNGVGTVFAIIPGGTL